MRPSYDNSPRASLDRGAHLLAPSDVKRRSHAQEHRDKLALAPHDTQLLRDALLGAARPRPESTPDDNRAMLELWRRDTARVRRQADACREALAENRRRIADGYRLLCEAEFRLFKTRYATQDIER
jgi:hypothetical protein